MMQPDSRLDETFTQMLRRAGFDADRGSAANAIEKFVGVANCGHSHQRENLAVKGPRS
jgi:hypothetical protein